MESVGPLLGRDQELRLLGRLLGSARNGRGGAMVVTGPPGIGKTALLDESLSTAQGLTTLRLDGFESEATMPYSAVQRLVVALRRHLPALRDRLREALEVASGDLDGPPPDRLLVGLGILGLLSTASQEAPLVCAIDDAHLVDSDSLAVLAFVARRLDAEQAALMFAGHNEQESGQLIDGVSEMALPGLDVAAAKKLLGRLVSEPIEDQTVAALVRATGGNPLALIDLTDEYTVRELSEFGMDDEPFPVGRHLQAHYVAQVRKAGVAVEAWLLLAAAESTGDLAMIIRASEMLMLPKDAQDQAEQAGLIVIRDRVVFRHALMRSAVYNSATGAARRQSHAALAAVARSAESLEQEAWHLSKAAVGLNPIAADRMELGAEIAGRRGGHASRAAILARSAELTPAGPERDSRNLGATEAALEAGLVQQAASLLDRVDGDVTDPASRGRAIVARCTIGMLESDPRVIRVAASMLVRAADEFRGQDAASEVRSLLLAFDYCAETGHLTENLTPDDLAKRLEEAADHAEGDEALISAALAGMILLPYERAVPLTRAALDGILSMPDNELMHRGSALITFSSFLWDAAASHEGLTRAVAAARDAGALQVLDGLLRSTSLAALTGASERQARDCLEQVTAVRSAMGRTNHRAVSAAMSTWSGEPRPDVLAHAEAARAIGLGTASESILAALALRDVAEGHYSQAFAILEPLVREPYLHTASIRVADFTEAACRSDHEEHAAWGVARLAALAKANGSPICLGVALRSRALITDGQAAEGLYMSAIETLHAAGSSIDLGRSLLVYGEWLRRMKRRHEAAAQLKQALAVFERIGSDAFAKRTRYELRAAGIRTTTSQQVADPLSLTAQESRIARLAGEGRTNGEIATELFISPNTVDYHLRKVFGKLGISSRRQLSERLAAASPVAE